MNSYAENLINSVRCNACPRKCNVDRNKGVGYCGATNEMRIAKVMVHNWEEPFLTNCENSDKNAPHGCGAIFFSNCNLKCVYCQNYEISNANVGKVVTPKELAKIFKELEDKNVCNIDLVTPTHFVRGVIEALNIYKPKIPIVYNTSGYENKETILALDGLVDIFLFDFKYMSETNALKYSNAKNYPEICKTALLTAKSYLKEDIFENGLMKKGIIVRHLLLPNASQDGIEILDFINKNLGKNTYVSLLNQYIPLHKASLYPEINKRPKALEYKRLITHAKELNMPNVFLQDEASASETFIPDFSKPND
ncbi:MAG: radical SAM protein [Clostridia bacterium]|nr:radical SAM protein [Clostridia bacterium]